MTTELSFLSRRKFLSAAVVAGGLAGLTSLISPAGKAQAASLDASYGSNVEMQTFPTGKGIIRTYKDAFTGKDIEEAEYFTGTDGRLKIAFSVIGLANQFQIIDALTGKNEFTGIPPAKVNGVISGLAWNKTDKHLYAIMSGTVSQFNHSTKTFKNLGQITSSSSAGYGPAFDATGNGWYGSFPDAGVGKFTPSTGAKTSYPNVDTSSEYVRSIAVLGNTVYCGTGAISPKIVSFPLSNPALRKSIAVPGISPTGFVFKLEAHAGRIFAFYEDETRAARCSVYNPVTGAWVSFKYVPSNRNMTSIPGDGWTYFIAKTYPEARNSIVRWNPQTNVFQTLAAAPAIPLALNIRATGAGNVADIFGTDPVTGNMRSYSVSLTTGKIANNVLAGVIGAPYKVQDFIASADGKIYAGGYQGDGISTIDVATDARWRSSKGSPIQQIEGMIEYGNDRLYVGSYGSADLIRFNKTDGSAQLIKRLRDEYMQSRPYAWAIAAGKVVCGTVPEYGLRGGALAIIDPATDIVEKVLNKYIPEQSIVGMTGNGDIVYGTTTVKGGYGISDDTSPAKVFAYNVRTHTPLWEIALPHETEIHSPVVVKGRLFVGLVNGIAELDLTTGKALKTWKLFSRSNTTGYRNVRLGYHPQTNRLIHCAGGTLTAIGLANDSRSLLYQGSPGTMDISNTGKIYMVTGNGRDISEIDSVYSPSITSASDIVAISSGGGVSLRRSNGNGGYGDPFAIVSSGYSDAKSVHIADWNGNGIHDLVSNHKDGTLRVRYGLPGGGFESFVIVSATGWATRRITVGRWNYSTLRPAVISIDAAGDMYLWQVSTVFTVGSPKKLGSGWKTQQFAILDRNYDKAPGLLVNDGGSLLWYPSALTIIPSSPRLIMAATGFSSSKAFTVVQKHKSGYSGIVWHDTSSRLRYMSNLSGKLGGVIDYGITWGGYRLGGSSS